MSTNPRGIAPLNWKALVNEVLRRRKAEMLTQRGHAAMANVSVPTMAAFDRGDTTLTLAKIFAILRVVGLVDEPSEENIQDTFVHEAFMRWQTLSASLPADSPARFPYGWYRFDYYLEGNLKDVRLQNLEKILAKAVTNHSGWSLSTTKVFNNGQFCEVDNTLEHWMQINDAVVSDFWRATPDGRIFFMQGYKEDFQEFFLAGARLDTTLPIWHLGEILLHAERLASLLQKDAAQPITVHFRALYSGLSGRILHWRNPVNLILGEERAARSDEALLEAHILAKDISAHLAEHLYPMVAVLYERFGVTELSPDFVRAEVKRLLNSRKLT